MCEKHFLPSDFVRAATYTDVKTGKVIEVPLQQVRLRPDAIPSLFPDCPSYLSRPKPPRREAPEAKRARLEAAQLREVIQLSIESQAEEDNRNKLGSFSDLLCALPSFGLSDFWTLVTRESKVFLLDLSLRDAVAVRSSVTVSADLSVTVFVGDTRIRKIGSVTVPDKLHDLRELKDVLHAIEQTYSDFTHNAEKIRRALELVSTILEEVTSESQDEPCMLDAWHLEVMKFLRTQVNLVLNNGARYPPELLVFASILFTISPHAYRFLRSSSKVKLPHPETIRRVCSTYEVCPTSEQQDACFLSYAKMIANTMLDHERTVTLMMDEIHLQSFFDYKGGHITGAATNSTSPAKTAFVFMIQSLLSRNKDVVHILPVSKIDANILHSFLRKLIIELEVSGLKVIAVISDNNSINRKAMSFFATPPDVSIVYKHPTDPARPLFFVVDPVHLLKCIRNNWLNQRNSGRCMYFPDPKSVDTQPRILTASFSALCELHESERTDLLKLAPTLSLKALNPSNMERQNVKLALRIFSSSTAAALSASTIEHAGDTAEYINTILTWWRVVNVKTPKKGQRLRDDLQNPITSISCPQLDVLMMMVRWLDYWASLKHDSGCLTRETHSALCHTSHALHELSIYCIEELGFEYVLLGKFQTDCLEDRFGKYRQLSGGNYHVSIRQIYESEKKLRLQKVLDLPDIDLTTLTVPEMSSEALQSQFAITVTDADYEMKSSRLPAAVYVAGYCAHAALKKLMCRSCRDNLVMQDRELDTRDTVLIASMTRGGLKFPREVVVNAVLVTEIVLDKLRSPEYAREFFALPKQREALIALVSTLLGKTEEFDTCDSGHTPNQVMHYILSAAANTLLNNLCKTTNDTVRSSKGKRKLETLKP